MIPAEKHREAAEDVYDNLARGHTLDGISRHDIVLAFAFAIARAEREGLKRAAEISLREGDKHMPALGYVISQAILSEAGEGAQ